MGAVTKEDVEAAVSRALGKTDVKILTYSIRPFSKNKNGCLGSHFSLTVKVEPKNSDENCVKSLSYFVKTQPDSPIILNFLMDKFLFDEEVEFYDKVNPLLMSNNSVEPWSPQCYLSRNGIMIMEDLRVKGYTIPSCNIMDAHYLRSALTTLARYHAASILVEKRIGKTLKEAFPEAFEEKIYSSASKFGQGTVTGYKAVIGMAKKFGLDSSVVPKIHDRAYELLRAEAGRCNVVCHGDLWKNNIMFDDGTPPNCLFVDYQFLRYASPTTDVIMLLYLQTTPEFRKKSELELFNHYYSVLRDTLTRQNSQSNLPAYEELLKDYQERRLVGMAFAALYLSGLYLKPEILAGIMNDPVELEKWFCKDRFDIVRANLDEDPVYEKRLRSIVTELIEEGIRIFGAL